MDKKTERNLIIRVYVSFLLSILLAGGIILTVGKSSALISKIVVIPCSWTPTLVVMAGLKKWKPEVTRREFVKSLFAEKVKASVVFPVVVIQVLIFAISIMLMADSIQISDLLMNSMVGIIFSFINSILIGATGEEICWRGLLHPDMSSRYGVIKGSAFLGLIWGFWHAPLWFLTMGYQSADLVKYIVCFLVFIVSIAIVIGISYERNKNLFVPVIIHFTTNFSLSFYKGDVLTIIIYIAVLHAIFAVVYAGIYIYSLSKRKRFLTSHNRA